MQQLAVRTLDLSWLASDPKSIEAVDTPRGGFRAALASCGAVHYGGRAYFRVTHVENEAHSKPLNFYFADGMDRILEVELSRRGRTYVRKYNKSRTSQAGHAQLWVNRASGVAIRLQLATSFYTIPGP